MTNVEILKIMKEAIYKIEIEEHRTECGNDLYEVELNVNKAIKYLDEKIECAEIVEKNKL